jgi:hypothetical protein
MAALSTENRKVVIMISQAAHCMETEQKLFVITRKYRGKKKSRDASHGKLKLNRQ